MSAKKYLKMPAVQQQAQAEKTEQQERLWSAIKRHILQERKRKQEELEAEVDKERLRKEREAREKENVMTLGETKEQINLLERKLEDLKKEKSQLFIQLKKVLNKDDNRKRQSEKEAPQDNFPPSSKSNTQMPQAAFLPPRIGYQITSSGPPNNHSVHKRKRSPSPPVQNYHRPVNEEHRRAQLWNKPAAHQSHQYRPTAITAIPYHIPQGKGQGVYPSFHGMRPVYQTPSSSQHKHDVQQKQNQPANIYHIDVNKHPDVRPDMRQSPYDNQMATIRRDQMPIFQLAMPQQNPGQVVKSQGGIPQVNYGPRPPSANPSHYPTPMHRY
uniref:CSON005517 protein n=1 Tax=Culicoides sonorensis TaxID=179676 RepID=A0A336L692_CULSO